jgi:hypothetical protein
MDSRLRGNDVGCCYGMSVRCVFGDTKGDDSGKLHFFGINHFIAARVFALNA